MLNREVSLNNLATIRDILKKYNTAYWIDGGTCLGAVREKDFIEIDDDTDIGVLEETFNDQSIEDIKQAGFKLEHTYGTRDKGYELAFTKDGVKTDIFFYYLLDGKRWYAMYADKMIPMVYPAEVFATQVEVDFLGQKFMLPGQWENYLTIKYGDYMTKIKKEEWDWTTGPQNIDMNFIK